MSTVTGDHTSAPHGNFVPSLTHSEKPKTALKMNLSFCKYVCKYDHSAFKNLNMHDVK